MKNCLYGGRDVLLKTHLNMTDQVHTPQIDQTPPPGPDREAQHNFSRDFGYSGDNDKRVHELVSKAMQMATPRNAEKAQYNRLPGHIQRVLAMYIEWRSKDGSRWADIFHWKDYIRSDKTRSYQGYFDSLDAYWQRLLLEGAIILGNPHGPDSESEKKIVRIEQSNLFKVNMNPYLTTRAVQNVQTNQSSVNYSVQVPCMDCECP